MPLDPSISLGVRGIETPNMLAQYAQIMGIKGAQNQNRLAEIQYQNAQRQQQDELATQEAFRSAGNDLTGARNALMAKGLYKPALALDEAERKRRLDNANIDEKELTAALKRLDAYSGLLGPLAMNPQVTHAEVMATGKRAEAMGLIKKGWEAQIPMNAMELPGFVRQLAMSTEQGRKSLEMLMPKAEKAGDQFVNINPLAGQVGAPIVGAPKIGMTAAERDTSSRGWATLAETRAEHERAADRAAATAAAKDSEVKPTKGQEEADKEFAKEYVAFKASGGIADVNKQLGQLQEAVTALETDNSLTGPLRGNLPDWSRSITNPKAIATKNAVEEVVQRNLRLVLGAQFTEKEGERLIARAYNERLEPAENAKRVKRLVFQISEAAKAKAEAADYFEKNGTLRGWNGKKYTISDFNPDANTSSGKIGTPQRRASDKTPSGFKVLGVEGK